MSDRDAPQLRGDAAWRAQKAETSEATPLRFILPSGALR